MAERDNIWVGIELTRRMRLVDGVLQPPGALAVDGVNLLERQIKLALELTAAEQVCVLTPQGDEPALELIGEHGLRELSPFDFIAMLADRARQGEDGAVVLLRQIAPLRDAGDIRKALKLLKRRPAVISASKPPPGHSRHRPLPDQAEPDYRCLAFEVRRMSEFGAPGVGDEALHYIDWDSFAELINPDDEPAVSQRLAAWGV